MNEHFVPGPEGTSNGGGTKSVALVTPSHADDFERCRLLCETIDAFVGGASKHYILVAHHDVALFRTLENEFRVVIDERDLLPPWLHCLPDPTSLFRRHLWVSTRTAPLRGWHVQQLRRIALAGLVDEDALVYCDSDILFLKPFDCGGFWRNGQLRFYRRERTSEDANTEHGAWALNAARALGLQPEGPFTRDYIATLIAWRRETVVSMTRHIESLHGRHWIEVIAQSRHFSECLIYGRYVDELLGGRGHDHDDRQLCRIYWSGPSLSEDALGDFVAGMEPGQVAIGIQSFVDTDIEHLRHLLPDNDRARIKSASPAS